MVAFRLDSLAARIGRREWHFFVATVGGTPAAGLRGRRRLTSKQGHGEPNPTWIPVANEAVRRIAGVLGGTAGGNIGEPFGMPLTVFAVGRALEQNALAARAMVEAGWEVASHGWRWIDYGELSEDATERLERMGQVVPRGDACCDRDREVAEHER